MADMLTVGSRTLPVQLAVELIGEYVDPAREGDWAYPSYDGYQTNDDPDRLCDGDLLAPVLLNVDVKIRTFVGLQTARSTIESALGRIAPSVDIRTASPEDLATVGHAFGILDEDPRPWGVKGTTLAKILHRKRPLLIPLYDQFVDNVYVTEHGPLRRQPGRSWVEFMTILVTQMQADIQSDPVAWDAFVKLRPRSGPPLSHLRVLDILAWRIGRDGLGEVAPS